MIYKIGKLYKLDSVVEAWSTHGELSDYVNGFTFDRGIMLQCGSFMVIDLVSDKYEVHLKVLIEDKIYWIDGDCLGYYCKHV